MLQKLDELEALALRHFSVAELKIAYQNLSQRYRAQNRDPGLKSIAEAFAYAIARMPATMAVINRILCEAWIPPTCEITDIGAGTGAATLAFLKNDESINHLCLENDPFMRKTLDLQRLNNRQFNILVDPIPPSEIILFSYVLGEIPRNLYKKITENIRLSGAQQIFIITPGTPQDFHDLLYFRSLLVDLGFFISGPCAHVLACPLAGTHDWCHFRERFPRSKLHMQIKGGALPYEDEKFSYVIFSKQTTQKPASRILKKPLVDKAGMHFEICTENGIDQISVLKRDKVNYKKHKKKGWGDVFNE